MKKLTVAALIIIIVIFAVGCGPQAQSGNNLIIVDEESGVYDFIADKDYGEIKIYGTVMAYDKTNDPFHEGFGDKTKWFEHTSEVNNAYYPYTVHNANYAYTKVYKGDKIRITSSPPTVLISIKIVSKDDESIYYEHKFKGEPEWAIGIDLPQSSN